MFGPHIFLTELAFTIIAVIFCGLIYFKTKEIYELTKYKGIKYFRYAFLFLGLSYAVRFVLSLFMLSQIAFDIFIPRREVMPLFILIVGYLSTTGILYLLSGSLWKKASRLPLNGIVHGTAAVLSVVAFITRSHLILLYLQTALLILAVILSLASHKKFSQMRIIYFLVFILWLINLWIVDRRGPFPFELDLAFQAISLLVFFFIYRKITKFTP
jgi:hypothetical protein